MRRKFITKQRTFLGNLLGYGWLWLLVALVLGLASRFLELVYMCAALWLVGIAVLAYLNAHRLKRRDAALADFATARNFLFDSANILTPTPILGAIDDLHSAKDQKVKNTIVGDDWTYYDFSYRLYGHTKYGDYRKAQIYYGVMAAELPRGLPNIFFDSIKARRRQFRFHFATSQRHDLEGDFSKHFVTYFPEGYTVDSLSIISPDVMWALKEAADYDIEIYNNHVFLYGPLYSPEQQIPDMAAKIKKVKKELMDNILTYRDERLPFADGKQRVAATGAVLKGSRLWKTISITGGITSVALALYARSMR